MSRTLLAFAVVLIALLAAVRARAEDQNEIDLLFRDAVQSLRAGHQARSVPRGLRLTATCAPSTDTRCIRFLRFCTTLALLLV